MISLADHAESVPLTIGPWRVNALICEAATPTLDRSVPMAIPDHPGLQARVLRAMGYLARRIYRANGWNPAKSGWLAMRAQ